MKRRVTIPVGLILGCVIVVALLEMTGQLGSGTGAAVGTDARGCAPPEATVPGEWPADVFVGTPIVVDEDRPAAPLDPWADAIAGQYVVGLAPEVELDDVLAHLDGARLEQVHEDLRAQPFFFEHLGLDRQFLLTSDSADVIATVEALEDVEWIEPMVEVRASAAPDDPFFGMQWHMNQLAVDSAWDAADGTDVVVAVVDTGVSEGPDGFGTLLAGYDFVDDDAQANDANGHGTHVAGTVAQATDNGEGVAGVAPGAAILPVRVLDADGTGSSVDVAAGIIWAVDNGADVINMSLGSGSPSMVIEEACAYAHEAGVLVVASSGNDGYTNFVGYPAAFDTTIAVGATDFNYEVAYYSNQGAALDLVAPGGDLGADHNGDGYPDGVLQETTIAGHFGYYFMSGTSMATPHVAGTAALLVSAGVTDVDDLRDALTSTADDLGAAGRDDVHGHGLVNPVAALGYAPPEGPAPFELINLVTRDVAEARVIVRWRTAVPSTTTVTGDNGWSFDQQSPSRVHRALARGVPGTTAIVTVSSTSEEGYTATQTVEITFPGGAA
jgi:serine protease